MIALKILIAIYIFFTVGCLLGAIAIAIAVVRLLKEKDPEALRFYRKPSLPARLLAFLALCIPIYHILFLYTLLTKTGEIVYGVCDKIIWDAKFARIDRIFEEIHEDRGKK